MFARFPRPWRPLAALTCATLAFSGVHAATPPTVRVGLWEPAELSVHARATPAQPFDVVVTVTARQAGHRVLEVPAYYDGDGTYRVRFTAPTSGTWALTSKSSIGELDGHTWTVEVAPSAGERMPPLAISPRSPTRFARVGGPDVAVLAFECDWLVALDYGDGGLPRTRRLLEEVAANGFNQIVLNVYAHDVRWGRPPGVPEKYRFSPPTGWPFGGTNDRPDFTTLSLDYFRHLDRMIALLDELKLSAHVMIYVWNKQVNWPPSRSAEDNRYFDYVIKRYQAFPNVVWDVSKEALGYGHNDMDYISERISRIRSLDAHQRLVTVHDYAYCNRHADAVDFIAVQQWKTELHGAMREIFARHPGKPVFNIEHGGYERGPYQVFSGDYDDPVACLLRNYECLFAGSDSTYYWQDSSWNILIWDPWTLPEKDRPQWQYFRHLRRFIDVVGVAELKPDDEGGSSGYCLSDGKDTFVYFFPAANARINITASQTARGTFRAEWFDPLTGEFADGGTLRAVAPWYPVKTRTPGRPAVLILRRTTAAD